MTPLAANISSSAFFKTANVDDMFIPNAYTVKGEPVKRPRGDKWTVWRGRISTFLKRFRNNGERLQAFDDLISKQVRAPPAPARRIFTAAKSKELDSGVAELETPDEPDKKFPGSRPSSAAGSDVSTRSAASAPPALCIEVEVVDSAPEMISLSSIISIRLDTAHDAALLRLREDAFQFAQRTFPADGVLFVGNLPAHFTDIQLSDEILNNFIGFGDIYIHIDRHYTREHVKPYALIQFTTPLHAENALLHVTARILPRIGGRPVRVERSNAKREMVVCRRDDTAPSDQEILRTFGDYGVMEMVRRLPVTMYQTLPKIGIKYLCYGSFLDAKKAVDQREGLAAAYRTYAF